MQWYVTVTEVNGAGISNQIHKFGTVIAALAFIETRLGTEDFSNEFKEAMNENDWEFTKDGVVYALEPCLEVPDFL